MNSHMKNYRPMLPWVLLLTSAVWVLPSPAAEPSGRSRQPNIIVILTDDMGFSDIGCYGGEINTPNLDKLAAGGLKFSQFYNCGKCEPSRAALVTGQQWFSHSPNVAVRKDSPNFGEVLRGAWLSHDDGGQVALRGRAVRARF